ncbi:cysteine protease StiP family protein [Clostridium sp. AM58-1XD]|uniref:cysteine protease StiP family protein n=1 Tax=Clostridium sp. AM58-1XD TaxID=2292307 RepID=UPI000E51BC17|nr:cysteine protease StiP family protein [Clostridium sp. AM58-1XD]RGY96570.1 hypothetical protein DXA13_16955 [Clostridium sp. AM58-1XD]
MRSTYRIEDVIILLKDITGLVKPLPTEEREKKIQSGTHYCEMLPLEYEPSPGYMEAYKIALKNYAGETAAAAAAAAEKILRKKGREAVLVSLARAGTSAGVLMKHYLWNKYKICLPHYTISIIRGKGIDRNAMKYLLENHRAEDLQFVDGWIGKGAILSVLEEAVKEYNGVSPELAVLADPAHMTELCGTHEDILIPSSCLNSVVSGLMSRTFLRDDIIGEDDFHGAAYYGELEAKDVTYEFINAVEKEFIYDTHKGDRWEEGAETECSKLESSRTKGIRTGLEEIREIAEDFNVTDINFIKPGIGETTRVLLRRVPWKILIKKEEVDDPVLRHIFSLAHEKGVEVVPYGLKNYKACGIIRKCSDV